VRAIDNDGRSTTTVACERKRYVYPIQIGGGVDDSVLNLQFELDGVGGSIA
jgi:hypothetical protein